ncbi:MAG: exodeoxyribonuclease VII small subunit [Candidatus Anoxymicrobium japonicum]|uniref:Exodeoxyribonuclease 7 small subunit n=1 Tax=Candidatus Anoxymicrobium japonicum TaxID=2013648 RepID=A0A2N3G7N5_9ACTN|nr:MAG: exodeoxyribonuclease VII small subunit [Candidatus Anoxymicrobium japonicum]
MKNEPTFKEAIEELEKITNSLESGELELEQSLSLFERGVELIKYCQEKLDGAQAKVELLVDSMEGEIESVSLEDEEENA